MASSDGGGGGGSTDVQKLSLCYSKLFQQQAHFAAEQAALFAQIASGDAAALDAVLKMPDPSKVKKEEDGEGGKGGKGGKKRKERDPNEPKCVRCCFFFWGGRGGRGWAGVCVLTSSLTYTRTPQIIRRGGCFSPQRAGDPRADVSPRFGSPPSHPTHPIRANTRTMLIPIPSHPITTHTMTKQQTSSS